MTVGRNEPCPCGSGQKYKSCCIGKERSSSRGLIYLVIAIAVIAAIGLGAAINDRKKNERASALPQSGQAARPTTPQPQPPGPVPAGKVWSAEHGHWHDANQAAQPTKENPITFNKRNVPQPPGPVPAGKVWSPQHGHWHAKKK